MRDEGFNRSLFFSLRAPVTIISDRGNRHYKVMLVMMEHRSQQREKERERERERE